MSLTRKEAMSDINLGRGISLTFEGAYTTFNCIIRRKGDVCVMVFDDIRLRRTYPTKNGMVVPIVLTTKQVMSYIRRHYPRHDDMVVVQSDPFKGERKVEVAA